MMMNDDSWFREVWVVTTELPAMEAGTGEGVDCNIRLVSPGCDEGLADVDFHFDTR